MELGREIGSSAKQSCIMKSGKLHDLKSDYLTADS